MVVWLVGSAFAGEGMWLPSQLADRSEELDQAGFTRPAAALGNPQEEPLAAIVGLGFCSASFVSPDGLLLTNAHCAEGFLNYNSTAELDRYLVGFAATSRAAELPAGPAARLWIVESITDVTPTIDKVVTDAKIPDADRVAAVERASSKLVAKCEKQASRSCEVVSQFGGQTWQLIQRLELRDVRLVDVPGAQVSYFGGDLDNFEWPRHDADFAVLRAYVGANGKPADPAPTNVPYHPPHWLTIDPKGVADGAPVMVAGYPGNTDRYALLADLKFRHEVTFPDELASYARIESLLATAMADPAAASRLQSTAAGVANDRKYTLGLQDNVAGSKIFADKAALEAKVEAWAAADPSRAPVTTAIRDLRGLVEARAATFRRDVTIRRLLRASLLYTAHTAYRWALEHQKRSDTDREPGLQDRDRDEILAGWDELDRSVWMPFDRALFADNLAAYAALPADQRVTAIDGWLAEAGGVDAAVERLFADPALAKAEARRALLGQTVAQLEASTDPWVRLAVLLERSHFAEARQRSRTRQGAALRLEPVYVGAVRKVVGTDAYPDANNTLRVTYGRVTGYAPRDGLVATSKTRLSGLVAKDRTPQYEAPDWLRTAAERATTAPTDADRRWFDPALDGVPVNFLSDVDTTGGNSGSATLDADGELVGLVFDGNYESMAADWQFDPATTRSIHVDIRYLLWVLAQDPGAGWIVDELVKPR
ncbi:MAG: S46 family peptidase [Myxococcota bacterium]